MIISLIVAMDERGGIGKENKLPWHLPSDLKRFKQLTMGHYILMGRKTFETIGRPLQGRLMIVISRKKDYFPDGCLVANSITAAVDLASDNDESELFIIGGGEIFLQAIGLADKIYLTIVHTDANADVFFPKFDLEKWKIITSELIARDQNDDYESEFKILMRTH